MLFDSEKLLFFQKIFETSKVRQFVGCLISKDLSEADSLEHKLRILDATA